MAQRTTRLTVLGLCMLGVAAQGLWAGNAHAQARGRIIVTQVPIPKSGTKAQMAKFFRKNGKKVIKKAAGATGYKMWVAARLSRKPSQGLLNLPQNGGKIHLVFYKKVKRKWKYVNVMNINYTPGAVVQFAVKVPDGFGISPGKTLHQLRLTVLNKANREIVLARTNLRFK